jgi:hypothetical protein
LPANFQHSCPMSPPVSICCFWQANCNNKARTESRQGCCTVLLYHVFTYYNTCGGTSV